MGRKHPSAAKPSAWCFVHAGNKPGQGAATISRAEMLPDPEQGDRKG